MLSRSDLIENPVEAAILQGAGIIVPVTRVHETDGVPIGKGVIVVAVAEDVVRRSHLDQLGTERVLVVEIPALPFGCR